jgi:2-haloacid dehalogenase
MTLSVDAIETVTVDSYGTLVDPSAVEKTLAAHVDETEPISNRWRSRSILYTLVSNYTDSYQPFYDMNRDALVYALESHGVELSEETIEDVLSTYHALDVFDDVRDGIERITDAGYEVYVVSNGNPAMLDSMVESADIGDLIEETISAHEIETFKPAPELYQHAAARTGTPIDRIVHVAGPNFDIQGAMNAGMQGAWINRDRGPWDGFAANPDVTIDSFYDLADELGV